jgi:predicted NAD-dependent protein-ADP-ribosyltransferase YbiA (DUF1768 family)
MSSIPKPPPIEEIDQISDKVRELYNPVTVFKFSSQSNTKPAPGKGVGETLAPDSAPLFQELASIPEWRRKLSNSWPSEFSFDNHQWATAEHYFEASKFKNGNQAFYATFALDSQTPPTDLAKNPVMAKAAASKTGKYNSDLLRPPEVKMDPDFFVDDEKRKKQELFYAQFAKFTQNDEMKKLLLATKDAKLVHSERGGAQEVYEGLMYVRKWLLNGALPSSSPPTPPPPPPIVPVAAASETETATPAADMPNPEESTPATETATNPPAEAPKQSTSFF